MGTCFPGTRSRVWPLGNFVPPWGSGQANKQLQVLAISFESILAESRHRLARPFSHGSVPCPWPIKTPSGLYPPRIGCYGFDCGVVGRKGWTFGVGIVDVTYSYFYYRYQYMKCYHLCCLYNQNVRSYRLVPKLVLTTSAPPQNLRYSELSHRLFVYLRVLATWRFGLHVATNSIWIGTMETFYFSLLPRPFISNILLLPVHCVQLLESSSSENVCKRTIHLVCMVLLDYADVELCGGYFDSVTLRGGCVFVFVSLCVGF